MNEDRYQRQRLVLEFGDTAQDLIRTKHIVIIGGGGLGSHSAEIMVRMGVGSVTVIDDDVVHRSNLHRTAVFTEKDVGQPKAVVLQERLSLVNADGIIQGIVKKVTKENISELVQNANLILDGTDDLETRFLINETALQKSIPWVYAGVYGTIGMIFGIVPGKTPCFACMIQTVPEKKSITPVLGNLPGVVASIQCTEALKILLGKPVGNLIMYDLWLHRFDLIPLKKTTTCPCCGNQSTLRKR
ncbi:MAG: HesA/MoeB/ThiF family protein [Candidatus Thermoplasmatota archaeon]